MSKKERRNIDDEIKVYRGVIPWSVAEHDWIVATFDERRKKNENLPLPEEFADYKDEFETLEGQELQNIKEMILFSDIFRQRYPKKLEYDAHFFRFNLINRFMQTHHDEFIKMKFVAVQNGKHRIAPQLIETLCTILYDQEEFDESGEFVGCTFSFPDVVEVTRLKMNIHLN
jgi:hypothetical protein